MNGLVVTTIGVGAALCSMASFVPQAMKIIREHDASGVSVRMYLITVVGFALWCGYGVSLKSWPLVGSNFVCLALSAWILVLKVKAESLRPSSERPITDELHRS